MGNMAPKKSKKTQDSTNAKLGLVMRSGKASLGYKQFLKTLRSGRSKVVIISDNLPTVRKSEIEYYALLGRVETIHYQGTNVDLGVACGKYFRVSVVSVTDAGDSDILGTDNKERKKIKEKKERNSLDRKITTEK